MKYFWAFVVGGGLCVVGQLLIDLTAMTPARVLVGYVTGGVALSALGLYGPLVDFAGAGATVPLLGFGHLLAQGMAEAVAQDGLAGVLTGGFSAAAGGVAASLTAGFAAALLAFALRACAGVRIVAAAHRERFAPGEVYAYYCGHALGRFFDYFSTLAVYLSFVVILAGAGAILEQQCGLPRALGPCAAPELRLMNLAALDRASDIFSCCALL